MYTRLEILNNHFAWYAFRVSPAVIDENKGDYLKKFV